MGGGVGFWQPIATATVGTWATTVASGPTFTPASLGASLALWLKADAISGKVDGNAISQWDDSSGNARHALQATGANQPLYKTAVLNGLPAVRFDGVDDWLVTNAFGPLAQPNEIFVVSTLGTADAYLVDGTGTARHAIAHNVDGAGAAGLGLYAGTTLESGAFSLPTGAQLFHGRFNTTSSMLRYRASRHVSGDAGSQSLGALTVAAGNAGAFGWNAGDVHEIIVVTGTLTEAQRWQVEQYLSDKWQVTAPRRPDAAQTTPTYDGSGQAVHPSVIDFQTKHELATWNGHRYWMAMTPYPSSNDDYENPSVLVSSDGASWSVPSGLSNPIDAMPPSGHNADAELEYDPETGTLHLFYIDADGTDTTYRVLHRSSTDGVTWTAETELLTSTTEGYLAPSVVYDGTTWRMWTVNQKASPNVLNYRTAAAATGPWSAATACTATPPTGKDWWHPMVFAAPRVGSLHCLMAVQDSGLDSAATDLVLMRSTNGTTWSTSGLVFEQSTFGAAWDATGIYRATAQLKDEDTYAVWYSAFSGSAWRIGYGELSTWHAPALP